MPYIPEQNHKLNNKVLIWMTTNSTAPKSFVDSLRGDCSLLRCPIQFPTWGFPFFSASANKPRFSLGLNSKKSILSDVPPFVFLFALGKTIYLPWIWFLVFCLFFCFGYDSHTLFISFMSEQFSISERKRKQTKQKTPKQKHPSLIKAF